MSQNDVCVFIRTPRFSSGPFLGDEDRPLQSPLDGFLPCEWPPSRWTGAPDLPLFSSTLRSRTELPRDHERCRILQDPSTSFFLVILNLLFIDHSLYVSVPIPVFVQVHRMSLFLFVKSFGPSALNSPLDYVLPHHPIFKL